MIIFLYIFISICIFLITFTLLYKLYFINEDITVECINIKTHDNRRKDLLKHMKNINFNPKIFNFCEAVTPDTLTTLETSQIDLKETRLACWLSHINIWRKYKYENEPILILEDDVRFNKDFQFRLNKILAKLKTIEWDMCFLGRVQIENKCANKSLNTCDLEWIKNGFHQTHCYLINGNSIPKLLNMCELNCIETKRDPKDFAIDVYISDLIKENKIKALGVKKQLAKQVSSDYYGSSTM